MTLEDRAKLTARAAELEAALNRFRAWYAARGNEEARLLNTLQAHRTQTANGVQKADALSAELSGIRVRLKE